MIRYLWLALAGLAAWWAWRYISAVEVQQQSGLQASIEAGTLNRYTTYNTQLYTPPLWTPLLRFFKAGAFVSTSDRGKPQKVDYSVQG